MTQEAQPGAKTLVENVVELGSDPFSDSALDAMRRYLLELDFNNGYLPQIIFSEPESRLWTCFWFAIRRIDDLVDQNGFEVLERIEAAADELDALVALRAFVDGAPAPLEARRRVIEMAHSISAERTLVAVGAAPSARQLFALWYYKAYVPTYVGLRLLLSESDETAVRRLSKVTGAALQWSDDLVDLEEDLALGRLWLCHEELAILGLETVPIRSLPSVAGPQITRLREAICLRYYLAAHEIAAGLPSAGDRRRGTAFVEQCVLFFARGDFRIYSASEPKPWEPRQRLLALLPGPEHAKQQVLHSVTSLLLALPWRRLDMAAARSRLEQLGGCPAALAPAVCLEEMERIEQRLDRGRSPARDEEASALERMLRATLPRDGGAGPRRRCWTSAQASVAYLRDPRPTGVVGHGIELSQRSAADSLRRTQRVVQQICERTYNRTASERDISELSTRTIRSAAELTALGLEALASVIRELDRSR